MSYRSPIEVIQTQMRNQIEDKIYKAVINVGVNVDKEELLKALQYDRQQYKKGYDDRDEQIVRCKDCRKNMMCEMPRDWFCADGERKD